VIGHRGSFDMKDQIYAMNALLIMTLFNVLIGILIVTEFIPLVYGLCIAIVGMGSIIWQTKRELMGKEKLWEKPERNKKE
jgi:hypothetical protein